MLFECFVEGTKEASFLVHGETPQKARRRAKHFLEYYEMPTGGLLLKKFKKPRKRVKQQKLLVR